MHTFRGFHDVPVDDPVGYAMAVFSEFDAKKVGNFEMILQHVRSPSTHALNEHGVSTSELSPPWAAILCSCLQPCPPGSLRWASQGTL